MIPKCSSVQKSLMFLESFELQITVAGDISSIAEQVTAGRILFCDVMCACVAFPPSIGPTEDSIT